MMYCKKTSIQADKLYMSDLLTILPSFSQAFQVPDLLVYISEDAKIMIKKVYDPVP